MSGLALMEEEVHTGSETSLDRLGYNLELVQIVLANLNPLYV